MENLRKLYSKLYFAEPDIEEKDLTDYRNIASEFLKSGDEDLQTAIAFTYAWASVEDKEIFDKILDTKNPIVINRLFTRNTGKNLTLEELKKLYTLTKNNEFLQNCTNHKDKNAKNVPNEIKRNILGACIYTYSDARGSLAKQVYKESSNSIRNREVYPGSSWYYTYNMKYIYDIISQNDEYNLTNKNIITLLKHWIINAPNKENMDLILSKLKNLTKDEAQEINTFIKDHPPLSCYHVVESGESLRGIIARYVLKNNICKDINDKKDWNNERKMKAAMEYARDFEKEISEKIGVKQENLKAGQVIDFSKVDSWPQPNWFNWKIFY